MSVSATNASSPCSPIPFGRRHIGLAYPVFIIAEIGINHEGNPDVCREMIEKAIQSGADAIKLTIVKADESYIPASDSFKIFKQAELPESDIEKLFILSRKLGVELFATCGDLTSFEFFSTLSPVAYKISSGLLTHIPLIENTARTGQTMLMSTGMAGDNIIQQAVDTARNSGAAHIGLFQCTSLYPAAPDTLNLSSISILEREYEMPAGFSDHSKGTFAASLAVAAGARMIEKHFSLDSKRSGFDHHISLEPEAFAKMVEQIRQAERIMGSAKARPDNAEAMGGKALYRFIVAKRDIAKHSVIVEEDIGVMRVQPGEGGLPPAYYEKLVGKKAKRNIKRYSLINEKDFR